MPEAYKTDLSWAVGKHLHWPNTIAFRMMHWPHKNGPLYSILNYLDYIKYVVFYRIIEIQ